jgi:hypothetical protein
MTPPPPADVRACGDPSAELFARLQSSEPAFALACAGLLPNEAQRDRILRDAFVTAASQKPDVARLYVSLAIGRPWLTDAGFFPLLTVAVGMARENPADARTLLLRASLRYPALALREFRQYAWMPFGFEVFEQAALAAPDEAVGLAGGKSQTAEDVQMGLQRSKLPEVAVLLRLAGDANLTLQTRQRAAVFFREIAAGRMSEGRAVGIGNGSGFFAAVASLRIQAQSGDAGLYDRVLENYAEVLFRFAQDSGSQSFAEELRQLSARDLYLLLTYGRTEEDDLLFATVFDRLLQPKLKATPPSKLLEEAHDLNLRRFLATAVAHHRLDAFLAADRKPEQADVLARAMRNLEAAERPLDEALACAEIVDAIQDVGRLGRLKGVVMEEYGRGSAGKPLYGLLAARIAAKLPDSLTNNDPEFVKVAARYRDYFKEPRVLDAAALFAKGVCIQQHFFYDDDDANESFDSFRQIYRSDRNWKWEDRGWYVHITGAGAGGRRIEIYANVPHSPTSPGSDDRRHALVKLMGEQGLVAPVVVHRGHTWYVDQSLRYLTPAARLVYLGSCRGMENAYMVIALANRAQMIATRGVGTQEINDPLLKALNDELLKGQKTLEWDRFWRTQEGRLGHNPMFRDYIPPPRNASAIMLSAYYDFVAEGKGF